jgi:hypothetical protein
MCDLVSCWFFFKSVYAPCYVRSDIIGNRKHGGENGAGLQVTIKWLGAFKRLLGTLSDTLGIML